MMKQENKIEFDTIKEALVNLKKPVLTSAEGADLKNRVFSRIRDTQVKEEFGYFSSLLRAIAKIIAGFQLESDKRARVKENIFALLETHSQRSFFWPRFFAVSYKVMSVILVVAIGFGSFIFMNPRQFVVRAAGFTALDNFEGNVLIQRGQIFLPAKRGMLLKEKDSLLTADDSFAVVKYFDDSVTRLAENTQLSIDKLNSNDSEYVSSYVEVSLDHGVLWSKVVNLFQIDSAFVVRASDVVAKTQRGAFNFVFTGDQLNIGVFSDAVEVVKGDEVDKVVSGEKVVGDGHLKVLKKREIAEAEKDQDWVRQNLESDKQHLSQVEKRLVAAKLEAIGISAPEDISFDKSLTDNVALFLTFDQIDRKKLELDLAERNFLAAQLKLQQIDISEEEKNRALVAMNDFSKEIKSFYEALPEVELSDKNYALELKQYLDNKVLAQKKDLSLTLPGSPVYGARELVEDLEILSANDDSELLEIKKQQATEKVAVIQEIVDDGNYDLAASLIADYKEDVSNVIEMIDSVENTDSQLKDRLKEEFRADLKLIGNVAPSDTFVLKEAKDELTRLARDIGILPAVATEVSGESDLSVPVVTTVGTGDLSVASIETELPEVQNEEPLVLPQEKIIEGPYGVKIKGDKPLDPLLSP